MKTIQIKSITNNILFEHKCLDNTIKKTIRVAIENNISLRYANFSNANLNNANLNDADFSNANFSNANLRYANLRYANLRYADLRDADLSNADLRYANLRYANLRNASFSNANFSNANFKYANLRYANLRYADLSDANLRYTDLRYADLRYADLSDADFRNADIRYANLSDADLSDASFSNADLRDADIDLESIKHTFQIIPEEGSFIAWKKLKNDIIAKILITEKAQRICTTKSDKCKASEVKTLALYDKNSKNCKKAYSQRCKNTIYTIGEITKSDSFNTDLREECSNGIHFFLSRKRAEEY